LSEDVTLYPPGEDDVDYQGDVERAIDTDVNFYLDHEHEIVSIDNIVELIVPYIPASSPAELRSIGGKKKSRKLKKKYTRKIKREYFV
jgi:hypothetical protein